MKINIKMNGDGFVTIKGKLPGKKVMVLGGVHGNEYFGVEAIQEILKSIEIGEMKIERGKVTFGFGNLRAMEKGVRYTETNLNRMFKDKKDILRQDKKRYEYKRSQIIKKYLNKVDVLLDVHGSYTPDSKPFVICEKNSKVISDKLGVTDIVYGFDVVEPGGTDYYMNKMGKIGICVECGYLGENEKSKNFAKQTILNFLVANGNVQINPLSPSKVEKKIKPKYLQMYQKYFAKTNNFRLSKYFKDFENVRKGQVVGTDGSDEIFCPKDSFILFASNTNKVGAECFLLGSDR